MLVQAAMTEYYRIVGSNSPSFFSASLHWTAKVKGPSDLISGEFLFLFAEGTFLVHSHLVFPF